MQLLSELDSQQLQITYKALEEKNFKSGEHLVMQGIRSTALFIIKRGHVKEIESVDGQVRLIFHVVWYLGGI